LHDLFTYFAGGLPFRQPKQLVSSQGLLEVTFNVEVTDFVVDWLTLRRPLRVSWTDVENQTL